MSHIVAGIASQWTAGSSPPAQDPAPGSIWIRRNDAETSPNPAGTTTPPGTASTLTWDTEVHRDTDYDSGDYASGEFTLNAGPYLVLYSERYDDGGSSGRLGAKSEVLVDNSSILGGQGYGYLRNASGSDEFILNSGVMLDLSAQSTIEVSAYRTDSNNVTLTRATDVGSCQILRLDDDHAYGIYTASGDTTSSTSLTYGSISWDTQVRQDTGFSQSTTDITIADAGRYLFCYSIDWTATGGRELAHARLILDSSVLTGTHSQGHARNSEGNAETAQWAMGIFETTSSNQVLELEWATVSAATHTNQGARLGLWKLPSGNEVAWHEATTGDYNTTSLTTFTWDTLPEIDTAAFTASAGGTTIDVDNAGDYLAWVNWYDEVEAVARAYPTIHWDVEGTNQLYGITGNWHRNSTSERHANTAGILLPGLSANDSISVETEALAGTGTAAVDSGRFGALRLSSVFS